jgi:hydrogenase maturation protein HypF
MCPDCLAELFDRADRRYRYAFINCTQCGPRYTIAHAVPYDRTHTSMAGFVQCSTCQAEYDDPLTRRFHAQPNACPECGPQLTLTSADGRALAAEDAVAATVARLASGQILAIKGLGGFHLACDARNANAVARLRQRKGREEKPLAVMVANAASALLLAEIDEAARWLLESRERPIVLLPKQATCDALLPGVAPGIAWLGVLLPYTPLHALLFHEAAGRPAGTAWLRERQPLVLIMTSANPGGEPLVIRNEEACRRLGSIADAVLMHDREILVRCDDSVVRHQPRCARHEAGHARLEAQGTRHEAGDARLEARGASHEAEQSGSPLLRQSDAPTFATEAPDLVSTPADSRTWSLAPRPCFVRRARGYTPQAIRLPAGGPPVLATGAWLKSTVCITRGDEAFLSQHIGDLDNAPTCVAMEETVAHLLEVLEVQPAAVTHDLHPDFHSTRFAVQFAHVRDIPVYGVQHHHAHIAAVLAEHRVVKPALGLALDGMGLGNDGSAWGGELLRVNGMQMWRIGHLRPLPLPGGDRAAREPWRMACAALYALGRSGEIAARDPGPAADAIRHMLARNLNCPLTTSAGRWFDAAAGLLRIKDTASFEGQAAMLLEGLAARHGPAAPLTNHFHIDADGTLDLLPLLGVLADATDAAEGAAVFHATLAEALATWVEVSADRERLDTVALGGGCFMNAILSDVLRHRLNKAGLWVLEAGQAPPNDGGLALGQALVGLLRLTAERAQERATCA